MSNKRWHNRQDQKYTATCNDSLKTSNLESSIDRQLTQLLSIDTTLEDKTQDIMKQLIPLSPLESRRKKMKTSYRVLAASLVMLIAISFLPIDGVSFATRISNWLTAFTANLGHQTVTVDGSVDVSKSLNPDTLVASEGNLYTHTESMDYLGNFAKVMDLIPESFAFTEGEIYTFDDSTLEIMTLRYKTDQEKSYEDQEWLSVEIAKQVILEDVNVSGDLLIEGEDVEGKVIDVYDTQLLITKINEMIEIRLPIIQIDDTVATVTIAIRNTNVITSEVTLTEMANLLLQHIGKRNSD